MKHRATKILVYLILILVINIGDLFSPKMRSYFPECVFPVNEHVHIFVTTDALHYIIASRDPSILMNQYEMRQSRPLYVLQNYLIGNSLMVILRPFQNRMLQSDWLERLSQRIIDVNEKVVDYLNNNSKYPAKLVSRPVYSYLDMHVTIPVFYLAYILSNLFILLIVLLVFEQIWVKVSDVPSASLIFYCSCFFLLSNVVVKTYFWTAHQQMCSLLAPILCVWVSLSVADRTVRSVKVLLALCFLWGCLALYYGNFLMLLPATILPWIWIRRREVTVTSVGMIFVSILCYALPTLVWILILKSKGVNYYNIEMAVFRQVVWISDLFSFSHRDAMNSVCSHFYDYWLTLPILLPVIGWLLLITVLFGKGIIKVIKDNRFIWVSINALLSLGFFFVVGYYFERLTFTISAALFCLTPLLIKGSKISMLKTFALFIACLSWYLFTVLNGVTS